MNKNDLPLPHGNPNEEQSSLPSLIIVYVSVFSLGSWIAWVLYYFAVVLYKVITVELPNINATGRNFKGDFSYGDRFNISS